MLIVAMGRLSVRGIFAALLAVFVTVGLSLSAAQASNMPMKMSMASGMAASGHSDFHDCDGGLLSKTKAMVCESICGASVIATLPEIAAMAVAEIMTTLAPQADEFLIGSRSPPDPYPPRSTTLG